MGFSGRFMVSFSDDSTIPDNNGADHRIRLDEPASSDGAVEGLSHEGFIGFRRLGHGGMIAENPHNCNGPESGGTGVSSRG